MCALFSSVNSWAWSWFQGPRKRRPLLKDAYAVCTIGENFNYWRYPVTEFGSSIEERELKTKMREIELPRLDFSKEKWRKATKVVDIVLERLLKLIKIEAAKYEGGLSIDGYIKQGSSREGLKTGAPDEFDALLLFDIPRIKTKAVVEERHGMMVPELATIRVSEPLETLKYPRLTKKGVFCNQYGDLVLNSEALQYGYLLLNSEALHEKVFTSMIDKAVDQLTGTINAGESKKNIVLEIKRRINQPSVNITITIRENEGVDGANYVIGHFALESQCESSRQAYKAGMIIDVDIVPGWLVRNIRVPNPTDLQRHMSCPVYAVFKWVEETHRAAYRYTDPNIVWRICSSGFEKHFLDVASHVKEQRYVITALRILKSYMSQGNINPPHQITTVIRSYFLKHVAFYCILYLLILNKRHDAPLSGVKESLGYLLDFLQICLEERKLPHFFHSNEWIKYIFPEYEFVDNALRYNLFIDKTDEALHQAQLSLSGTARPALRAMYTKPEGYYAEMVKEMFRQFVSAGEYYI